MEIKYCYKKASTYDLVKLNQDSCIVATKKASYDKAISIYKNENETLTFSTNRANRIYIELENIASEKEKISFCNKYGTLVNPQSPIPYKLNFRINTVLSTKASELAGLKEEYISNCHFENDFMMDEHFTYYIKTLQLITKLSPLSLNMKEYHECFPLVDFIIDYLPLVLAMLNYEYECYEDGFETYLQAYPFYHFVFTSFPIRVNDGSLTNNELECLPSEYPLYKLIEARKSGLSALQVSKIVKFSAIKSLFADIYADVINFHMKNIPFSLITPFMKSQSITFYSLGDAIIFQKILDETQAIRPLICANKLCQNLFWPADGHWQIYCTPRCGEKVAKRKYKKKMQASSRVVK